MKIPHRQAFTLTVTMIVCALALLDIGWLSFSRSLDWAARDVLLRADADDRAPAPGIVIIDVDERSLELMANVHQMGRWPWSRAVHGELLEQLLKQHPRAIVFDILFSDWDDTNPDADEYFVSVARSAEQVFFPLVLQPVNDGPGLPLDEFGYTLGFEKLAAAKADAELYLVPPLRPLAETGRIGSINFVADADGLGRRYANYTDIAGWRIPSLPNKVAGFLDATTPATPEIHLHWSGAPEDRERYSYADVWAGLASGDPAYENLFTDTIVIIGGTAASLYDMRASPVSNTHPGVDILATAIGNLMQGDWLRPMPVFVDLSVSLILVLVIGFLFLRGKAILVSGLLLLAAAMIWMGVARIGISQNLLFTTLPVLLYPLLAFLVLSGQAYWRSLQERQHAIRTFSRFIDPRVANQLVAASGDPLAVPPQSREITILFSDIRGFTTLSETRSPEEILSLLNRYFQKQVDVIFRHGGTIDKFIGDAIMAFWGAPVDDPLQAENAIRAALEMAEVVAEFRNELAASGIPFDIGIGIHTGRAVVGFIGAHNRLDYTAIGDSVNLASRIEGQTKDRARILVSGDTWQRCREKFRFEPHGEVNVKGRQQAVQLFEPIG